MKSAWRAPLANIVDKLNGFVSVLCHILLSTIVAVTVMQVYLRYFLNRPTSWSEEVALLCLIWYGLLSVAVGIRRQEHISITFFRDALSPVWATALDYFAQICMFVFMFVLMYFSRDLLALVGVQVLPASGLPKNLLYYPALVGGALGMFNATANIILRDIVYTLPETTDLSMDMPNGN